MGFLAITFKKKVHQLKASITTGDEWKSSTRVSAFNTFDVWKYVVPFFSISFFFFFVCLDDVHTQMSMCH